MPAVDLIVVDLDVEARIDRDARGVQAVFLGHRLVGALQADVGDPHAVGIQILADHEKLGRVGGCEQQRPQLLRGPLPDDVHPWRDVQVGRIAQVQIDMVLNSDDCILFANSLQKKTLLVIGGDRDVGRPTVHLRKLDLNSHPTHRLSHTRGPYCVQRPPRVALCGLCTCCVQYPGGSIRALRFFHTDATGLCRYQGGSTPASNLSRPAQASLALRPVHLLTYQSCRPLSLELRRISHPLRLPGNYPGTPTIPGVGLPLTVTQHLCAALPIISFYVTLQRG